MSSRTSPPYRPLGTTPRPFPTRGIPNGWKDPWDDDPLAVLRGALPRPGIQRRHVIAADHDRFGLLDDDHQLSRHTGTRCAYPAPERAVVAVHDVRTSP